MNHGRQRRIQEFLVRNWRLVLIALVCMSLAIAARASYVLFTFIHSAQKNNCIKHYQLTNKDLDCDQYEDVSNRLDALDAQTDALVAKFVKEGKVKRASVWVRDLTSSQWSSTNEQDTYTPASLMKLPLMVAYYKVAELNPGILSTKLVFAPSQQLNSVNQDFEPASKLRVNHPPRRQEGASPVANTWEASVPRPGFFGEEVLSVLLIKHRPSLRSHHSTPVQAP
jgi:hypothetical protein